MGRSRQKAEIKIGDIIGCMKITGFHYKIHQEKKNNWKRRARYFELVCVCGKTSVRKENYLMNYRDIRYMSCGCQHPTKGRIMENNPSWTGYKGMPGDYLGRLKRRAKRTNLIFDLDNKFLWELYIKQNKKCAISGIPIYLRGSRTQKGPNTGSLDRIDSNKGYTKDNVQWVHKDVNIMKNKFKLNHFLSICALSAIYNKHKLSKNLQNKLYPEPENTDLLYLA